MASAGAITKFFTRTDTFQNNEDDEEQLIAKKHKKNSTTETETRGFLQSWLVEFEWLCYNSEANVMYCDFCQGAGPHLDGNTEYVDGSTKFKKENIGAHGKSQKHAKCRDWALSNGKTVCCGRKEG